MGALMTEGARLITLTGTGGIGKTRLAREFGARHGARLPGGTLFVDLADAATVDQLCLRIAATLGVPLSGDDPVGKIGATIDGLGASVVILDNFEQLVETAHSAVSRWVEMASSAHFIVTSRELLRVTGEHTLEIAPLDLPGTTQKDPALLAANPCVALFVDRAKAVVPAFQLDASNAEAVVTIVRRLEGIPLALELAAERLRLFEPDELCERLVERFRLLRGRRRDVSERHGTLRATIDWSWDLLQPWQQAAMSQCSVFAGGATARALEAVIDLSAWPQAPWLEDVIQSLLDKSILTRTERRLRMYESVREYASERLAEAAERDPISAATATRHAEFFATLGTPAYITSLNTSRGLERLDRLVAEMDNLQAALAGAMEARDVSSAASLASAIIAVTDRKGPYRYGAEVA
ncbi:MAG: AAA family ATPase, partial [Myxococcota bacterium]|nr:AAA family ATPase [Myxococcota bacterium]